MATHEWIIKIKFLHKLTCGSNIYIYSKCVFHILKIEHQLLETSSMTIIQIVLQSLITMIA